ncbi:unnamed protein product [Cuscuta campestris]|uniref:Uncharacterized protein n=1 Tax=Cuscuta campestris TaxID=132261 RepID=A0A484MIZ1_9ASTE|nr:unnamed protein product [Cuscuta campestris]
MHNKQSPILSDRSVMRDLAILQRSRSLRDPSASPPPLWQSPPALVSNGRHSVGTDCPQYEVHRSSSSKVASSGGDKRLKSKVDKYSSGSSKSSGSQERARSVRRDKSIKQSGRRIQEDRMMTLSEQLHCDEVDSSSQNLATEANIHSTYCNRRVKRHPFRGSRRTRASGPPRDASNSLAKCVIHMAGEESADKRITRAPRNGCGIPLNWSKIHDRSKSFLDMAGKSFSCGLSESMLKKDKDIAAIHVSSEYTDSSSGKSTEALPLLFDDDASSVSLGSKDNNVAWAHDYSGDLGDFADDLLMKHKTVRHQSLTQKYMPRTFRDLVGQHLVTQALSNAVSKSKVGLLYAFYGPHGTGKTSCARVFAKALNCQSPEHSKPCEICNSCIAYDTGKKKSYHNNIKDLLDSMIIAAHLPSRYRVFIFDDCDALSADSWCAIIKAIDCAPRRFVVILICSSLDVLPHMIISRCHKFFFPKLKDADVIYALQWIATKEGLEIDKDALKLIATRSDGSLRDAEMTLEQLSLLGLRISVPLVQELVGLISDEKLVDLLDLALSADTANTVRNLREIMESGVEPLALMSQLATVITDILAGSYDFTKDSHTRKFFRYQALSKEDMERLRQALKTLSEAEKQLRTSKDQLTWLTAALLQLAPDQQDILPSSSAATSLNESPANVNYASIREIPRKSNGERIEILPGERGLSTNIREERYQVKIQDDTEEIWVAVLKKIRIDSLRQFLYQEAKLVSVRSGTAPTVQLMFSSHTTKNRAEKFRVHILQAFESIIGSPVTIEIRVDISRDDDTRAGPVAMHASQDDLEESEVINEHVENVRFNRRSSENDIVEGISSVSDVRKRGDGNQNLRLVRGKPSVAQQEEGSSQESGWSKQKAVSIAEKLEQENLRLEPRSRSLLCWKATPLSRRQLSHFRCRSRKPKGLLKLVSCGKCLSGRSPRQC